MICAESSILLMKPGSLLIFSGDAKARSNHNPSNDHPYESSSLKNTRSD